MVLAGRGIVTPQGVVLDLETAGLGYRSMAKVIDLVVVGLGIGGLAGVVAALIPGVGANVMVLIAIMLGLFGYPAFAETWWRGRTIGKAAMQLRVVTLEAGPVGFYESLIRSLFQLLEFMTLGVSGLLTAFVTDRSQRLGDIAAGTFVIREPDAVAYLPAVPFTPPMGTEGLVAELDVSRLRPDQERVIRSFLLRVGELSRASRLDLGPRLATSTASHLGHDSRMFGDAERYLAAVMAARQLREGGLAELAIKVPKAKGRRFRRS